MSQEIKLDLSELDKYEHLKRLVQIADNADRDIEIYYHAANPNNKHWQVVITPNPLGIALGTADTFPEAAEKAISSFQQGGAKPDMEASYKHLPPKEVYED